MNAKSSNPAIDAAVAAKDANKVTRKGKAFANAIIDFAALDAVHFQASEKARPKLAEMARDLFTSAVTVAFAAQTIGLDLSVKGMDREDKEGRLLIQRMRVTLQRALNDAELLAKDATKGRKAKGAGEAEGEGSEPAELAEKNRLQAVLNILPSLSADELDALAAAVAEMLEAQLAAA